MENELVQDTNEVLETTNTEVVESVETPETTTKSLKELLKESPELQEEFNNMTKNRLERQKRDMESKYSRLETVLNAGLGTSNMEEATTKLEGFYRQKGIDIPQIRLYEGTWDSLAEVTHWMPLPELPKGE